jgi:hypothetical protein
MKQPFLKNFAWFCLGIFIPALFAFTKMQEKRVISIMLEKQKTIYLGVVNPISVAIRGVGDQEINVIGDGLTVKNSKIFGGYNLTATKSGQGSIVVTSGDFSQKFDVFIHRFPSPTPLLGGGHNSRTMGNGEFKAQGGITALMTNSDFGCGTCNTDGYSVIYQPLKGDPIEKYNQGSRFVPEVQTLINRAKSGDTYYFNGIKARCPGDEVGNDIGSLKFKIN